MDTSYLSPSSEETNGIMGKTSSIIKKTSPETLSKEAELLLGPQRKPLYRGAIHCRHTLLGRGRNKTTERLTRSALEPTAASGLCSGKTQMCLNSVRSEKRAERSPLSGQGALEGQRPMLKGCRTVELPRTVPV